MAGTDTLPPCTGCQSSQDRWGDHLLCCPRNNFSQRHNAVQDALFNALSSTHCGVQKEVALPDPRDSHLRPADLLLANWQNGRPTAVDVTVSHGWSQASRNSLLTREKWRAFLKRKEAGKHDKYSSPCERAGWHFIPMAFGTWGGTGPEPRGGQADRPHTEAGNGMA